MRATFADIREYLSYSPETGEFTWIKKPGGRRLLGRVAGKISVYGYRIVWFAGHQYQASHLAWYFEHGEMPSIFLDHINGNRSDNRLSNLRLATYSQNARNRAGWAGRGLPKGVYKSGLRFIAEIKCDGVKHRLGSFPAPELAAAAYADAAVRLHGEFARLAA